MTSFDLSGKQTKASIQAKLTIGQPNDPYEQEADRMADQVMRMPEGEKPVQRLCEECEDSLQLKPLAEGITPLVQRQPVEEAKAGDLVGVKVQERVRERDKVYKVVE